MLEIYNSTGTLQCSFPRVLSASLCDKLSGERTLSFSVLTSRSQPLSVGMTAKLDGQFYTVVRVSKKITGGFPVTTAQCEHITYLLNEEQYNLVTFVFEGTPADGMVQLLSGTPFSVGVIEATGRVECAFTDQSPLSRRSALMRFADACGCEVEYAGYKINLRRHRGSKVRKRLMDGENVTDLAVTIDSRENTQSYEISLFKMADLQAGDEVNITYTPMGVNVDTRIISIEYDPFYRYTVRVEVGDYVPNLLASTATQLDRVRQEFKAADGKLYVSAIFDCFDVAVVGLAMADNMRADLCVETLVNAYRTYPELRGCIIHSDRGSQYTSEIYRNAISKYGIIQSMNSAGGRCHDNARCESMWARMKEELLYGRYNTEKLTIEELKNDYLAIFYELLE